MFDLFFEFDTSDESPKLSIVGGGNPVASSKGTSYFNDMLGTTVGSKSNGKYSAAALTAFGENLSVDSPTPTQNSNFFTGKPYVEGLGHAFWMRNYRAGLAKGWGSDPSGYDSLARSRDMKGWRRRLIPLFFFAVEC